jgi:hypothetical protein
MSSLDATSSLVALFDAVVDMGDVRAGAQMNVATLMDEINAMYRMVQASEVATLISNVGHQLPRTWGRSVDENIKAMEALYATMLRHEETTRRPLLSNDRAIQSPGIAPAIGNLRALTRFAVLRRRADDDDDVAVRRMAEADEHDATFAFLAGVADLLVTATYVDHYALLVVALGDDVAPDYVGVMALLLRTVVPLQEKLTLLLLETSPRETGPAGSLMSGAGRNLVMEHVDALTNIAKWLINMVGHAKSDEDLRYQLATRIANAQKSLQLKASDPFDEVERSNRFLVSPPRHPFVRRGDGDDRRRRRRVFRPLGDEEEEEEEETVTADEDDSMIISALMMTAPSDAYRERAALLASTAGI